jgi:pimeloyl-ACP methyl ester carboxylesterase
LKSYENQHTWKEIQHFLPQHNRITNSIYPEEKYWDWEDMKIHIDSYPLPSSKVKLILLHGIGGNGRLLSFIAGPLYKNGYEVICPDLPGYGITNLNGIVDYSMWVNFVKDYVAYEIQKDQRPIILFGLSAGGMLAYHAGCNNKDISGLIFTNLLDQRLQKVRDSSALNIFISRIGFYFISFLDAINSNIKLPMKLVANMKAIVNKDQVRKV